ncbi:hypothetical protein NM688_g7663 [Phlebia brevispora]|uniref:Uncharacterized protein n=1 Tax=Phlebia brevispora TaxID=194682 RepID=A0ACC1S2K6_9APHY|nr:hypothetical protein NM688_g7663 [Phlebia brevispora]
MGVPYEFRPFCMPALRKVFLDNASHVAAESALTQTQIALQESEGERRAALLQIEEMRMQLTLYDKIGSDAQQEVLRLSTELRMKEEALAQQQQRLAEKQREVYSIDGQLHDVEQRLEAMTIRSNEQELGVHTLEEDLREARAKIVEQAKTVDTLNGKLRDTDQNSLEKDRALVEKDRALVEKDRALMEKDCALRAAASKNSSRKQSTPQAPERVNRSRRKTSLAISNRDSKALSDAATNGLAQDSSTTPAADVIGSASPPNDLLDSENIPRTCTEQKEHEWTRQGTNQHALTQRLPTVRDDGGTFVMRSYGRVGSRPFPTLLSSSPPLLPSRHVRLSMPVVVVDSEYTGSS